MAKVTTDYDFMFLAGKRLKECREICGFSQDQLAEAVENLIDNHGKSRSAKHISYLENGTRQMSVEYAILLAQALKVRPEYLLLKDNFRTEADRLAADASARLTKYDLIIELLQQHGYDVEDATGLAPTQTDGNGKNFRPAMIALVSPRGSKRLFTSDEFSKFVSLIDDSIEMQCAFQFRKLRDGVRNIYDWEV